MTVDYSMFRDPFKKNPTINHFSTPDDTPATGEDSILYRYRPKGAAYARIFRYWTLRGEEFIREITKVDPRRRFSDPSSRRLWETQRNKFKLYREGSSTYELQN